MTLDRTMYATQAASLEFKGMQNLTDSISKMMLAYGEDKSGFILDEEKEIAKKNLEPI